MSITLAKLNQRPTSIVFMLDDRVAFTILPNGTVELGPGISMDEASRTFWMHVNEFAAQCGWALDMTGAAP